MRYWLHDECGHAQAHSNSYHNGEKSNPHLTASLLELRTPGGTVIVALEPAALSPFDARDPRRYPGAGAHGPAPERNSILNVIVPADGTRAATVGNGDFGTSPIFGQLPGQAAACPYSTGGMSDLKRNTS